MPFNSIFYLIFLAFCTLFYYLLPNRARAYFLLAASLVFYCHGGIAYLIILLSVIAVTYFCAVQIQKGKKAKLDLTLGIVFCVFCIIAFKITSQKSVFQSLFSSLGKETLMPIGLSFFTFQAISYLVDVYKKRTSAEKNIFIYALFISFFPQLTQGPIERANRLIPALKGNHGFDPKGAQNAIMRIAYGLFKKCVVADSLAIIVKAVFANPYNFSGLAIAIAGFSFSLQIYFDASAYCDIAIASARLFGIKLSENFRCPYFADSIREYWHRWHITLSAFLRDYLYFPLGGSKKSRIRTLLNILIVFFVSGLWHGFSFSGIIWGVLNALFVCFEFLMAKSAFYQSKNKIVKALRIILTFFAVTFSLIVFRSNTVKEAFYCVAKIFAHPLCALSIKENVKSLGADTFTLVLIAVSSILIAAIDVFSEIRRRKKESFGACLEKIRTSDVAFVLITFVLLASVVLFGNYGKGYNPSDFFYFRY